MYRSVCVYIHFTSNHDDRVKWGVIKCLRSRATRICEAEDLEAEEEHLKTAFQKNSYPRRFVESAMRPCRVQVEAQQAEETATEEPIPREKTLCMLPYVKGTSDKLGNICRKAGVQPAFQQKTTLRSMLTRVKRPQKHVDKGVVYQIPCNRETPLVGNFVGRCQGHKSDVSTQSWVLISEKIMLQ